MPALTNNERFPLIKDLSFLDQLKHDQYAPNFNFDSGDRLQQHHLEKVKAYANKIRGNKKFWGENELPIWLNEYLHWCIQTVPYYKSRPASFYLHPTIRRSDIREAPWYFVSDDCSLDDLLVYHTSGTTGAPMDVNFDPVAQACWIPQLQSILDLYNINLNNAPASVAIALICAQHATLTYASLSSYLNGAGILKLNLNEANWNHANDRLSYLEKYNPEILTGDPFAFLSLLELKPNIKPKALVSSAMKVTDGIRKQLEEYFQCPVIDIYSMTECRMIAFAEDGRHRAIRPDLYLEIFDSEKDIALPYGERGELVITGGNNPFLPLIRYRTGDFCKLQLENGIPYLYDLEARSPVPLYKPSGQMINNVDISRAMTKFPLAGFTLHQDKNFNIKFTGWSREDIKNVVEEKLRNIFGEGITIEVNIKEINGIGNSKPVSYSSDVSVKL